MGWRNVVALHSNDAQGQSSVAAFRAAAGVRGINALVVPFDPRADDWTPQFNQIASSYNRIIVFLTTSDNGQALLLQALYVACSQMYRYGCPDASPRFAEMTVEILTLKQ
ncbi:hypothetical protein BCR44DRAFT_230830 [Catenaria anguillulae PL171]|uniref:Receptor ligand binding region domain-containing protein n=1 Tax=Catenaria anguillulae PL171 TaxID=765915 RepID=A0A1Y2I161_9FUNG|nr:hypothetical protein BCR44DRAFT_230830 [Catenaria anguillulae PL171]